MSNIVQRNSRKELQERIKKALASKPTASSLYQHKPNYSPTQVTAMRASRSYNKRPRKMIKPVPASYLSGQTALLEQECRRRNMPEFHPVPPFAEDYVGSFKHSGDLGDMWYSLPIIKYMGRGIIYLCVDALKAHKCDGSASGLTVQTIEMARPLLEAQPYITECKVWNNEHIDVDIDIFRRVNKYGDINLCELILQNCGVPFSTGQEPWLTCGKKCVASTVFARSPRYHNPNICYTEIYNTYKKDAVFVGLPNEYEQFKNNIGAIPYYPVKDFLELAEIINGADLFIGNQSSPMALAIALGANIIQEACPSCPNCLFSRKNAKYLL